MKKLIEFKNVSFRYQEDGPWVLRNCTFDIFEGESVAIIGHNGSGKSTIAKLMNGLLFPNEGEVWINGKQLTEESVWEIRKEIGMVFQNPDNQFVGATVQDDVAFGMENRGMPRALMEERITDTLEAVNMSAYRNTEPHRLSGGQKQRVAIAGVIAIAPKVMILDEATVMLDPVGRVDIMNTVTQLQKQKDLTFISITHDLNEAIQVDKVIVLNQGEIWAMDQPRRILNKGKELEKIGLAIPFISALRSELTEHGILIKHEPLTMEEMIKELWTLHSAK